MFRIIVRRGQCCEYVKYYHHVTCFFDILKLTQDRLYSQVSIFFVSWGISLKLQMHYLKCISIQTIRRHAVNAIERE